MKGTKTFFVVDRIEKLGRYFVYFDIRERFGLSFEEFVQMVDSGRWENFITQKRTANVIR